MDQLIVFGSKQQSNIYEHNMVQMRGLNNTGR